MRINNGILMENEQNIILSDKKDKTDSKDIAVISKISKADKYLPPQIVIKLYDSIDEPRDLAYLMYHIETGLRVSDVVRTEIVHLNLQEMKTYTYDHKKDKWRWIYWPEKVKAPLKMWFKQRQIEGIKSPYLFPFSEKTANRILKRWLKAIDFQYYHLASSHWCRHTFIRLSRKAGRDIKVVQQNTGDTIVTLLEWYSDLSSEDIRKEIENKKLI